MIKTLTKQYRKGTLQSGFYYFKNGFGQTYAVDHRNVGTKGLSCVEVLEEVPTYIEYEKLKKQLEIAVAALEEYTIKEWAYEDEYNNYPLGTGGWYHAHEALKQIKELDK